MDRCFEPFIGDTWVAETAGVYLTVAFFCAMDGPAFQQGHLSGERKNFYFS
jgi:hypothetical protein